MNKSVLAVLAVVLAAGFLIFRIVGHTGYDTRSIDKFAYNFKCASCGATFTMNFDEMKKQVRAGTVEDKPGQMRTFSCPKCGKLTANYTGGIHESLPQ